jgi:hypothetical protein
MKPPCRRAVARSLDFCGSIIFAAIMPQAIGSGKPRAACAADEFFR